MNRTYWDNLAASYDEQIFSVLQADCEGLLTDRIARYGRPRAVAADLGCGPGQITPLLAHHFGRVEACDLSPALLDHARQACAEFDHVGFHRFDLAGDDDAPFAPADLVLCVNVILTAQLEARERLWDRVSGLVAPGGTLLLVLPSHESALYTNFRRLDWHVRAGASGEQAIRRSLPAGGDVTRLEHGVRGIEGVETKHYLREEIMVQLRDRSLRVEEVTKLTYDWQTEFDDPPAWLGSPFPWNWLAVAHRD